MAAPAQELGCQKIKERKKSKLLKVFHPSNNVITNRSQLRKLLPAMLRW